MGMENKGKERAVGESILRGERVVLDFSTLRLEVSEMGLLGR